MDMLVLLPSLKIAAPTILLKLLVSGFTVLPNRIMKTAKQLAGELGMIRKRTFHHKSHESKNQRSLVQYFPYLIVIDFESTCWKDKRNPNQEIILINTSTGEIESEYHTYCLPEENPRLSSFCTELTGITQEQVESGIPLFLCLKKFSRWLKQLETDKNIAYNTSSDQGKLLCTFVTWSDWDLGVCLHNECRRKQLLKPDALRCWIDLRATYRKFYQRIPKGLEGALKDLGIKFEGRQHSGLDDARNTAYLAWRMIRDGSLMKLTKNGLALPISKGGKTMKSGEEMTQNLPPGHKTTSSSESSLNRQNTNKSRLCMMGIPTKAQTPLGNDGFTSTSCRSAALPIIVQPQFKVLADLRDCSISSSKQQLNEIHESNLQQTSENLIVVDSHTTRDGFETKSTKGCSLHQFKKRSKTPGGVTMSGSSVTQPGKPTGLAQSWRTPCNRLWQPCLSDHVKSVDSSIPKNKDISRGLNIRGTFGQLAAKVSKNESTFKPPKATNHSNESTLKTPKLATNHPSKRKGMLSHSATSNKRNFVTSASLRNCKSTNASPSSTCSAEKALPKPLYATGDPALSAFRTPLKSDVQLTKITPPLCNCGKRARRKTVFSPGPNQGRPYFSCCGRRQSRHPGLRDFTNYQGGCNFFKWESLIIKDLRTPKSSKGSALLRSAGGSSSI